jgi:hypothetical protein
MATPVQQTLSGKPLTAPALRNDRRVTRRKSASFAKNRLPFATFRGFLIQAEQPG